MIRLIASDMDGSLLNDRKQIPQEFFQILPLLRQRGISFVVASGRSYCTLRQNFSAAADEIDYICDNGAFLVHDGVTSVTPIPNSLLGPLVQTCNEMQGVQALLCGRNGTYHKPYSEAFNFEIGSYYVNQKLVKDLNEVQDEIFKIAICDAHGPENGVYPVLRERFGEALSLQISGKIWMDVMCRGVNKGAALEKIQSAAGISPEETMAFGDYYNDIELLGRAYYSFAMKNSAENMRQYARFAAAGNNEGGVIRAIREYALREAEQP